MPLPNTVHYLMLWLVTNPRSNRRLSSAEVRILARPLPPIFIVLFANIAYSLLWSMT